MWPQRIARRRLSRRLSDVPPLVLDDGMTQASLGYVGAVLPKSAFLPLFHAMASEDFALISEPRSRVRTLPWALP